MATPQVIAYLDARRLIPRLASIAFGYQAARDADEGRPVMITGAVPEQVAAYQLIAGQVAGRLTGS